jgi:hypothetical protein
VTNLYARHTAARHDIVNKCNITYLFHIRILFAIDAMLVLPSDFSLFNFFFFAVSFGCPAARHPKWRTTGAQILLSSGRTVSEIHHHTICTWVIFHLRHWCKRFLLCRFFSRFIPNTLEKRKKLVKNTRVKFECRCEEHDMNTKEIFGEIMRI